MLWDKKGWQWLIWAFLKFWWCHCFCCRNIRVLLLLSITLLLLRKCAQHCYLKHKEKPPPRFSFSYTHNLWAYKVKTCADGYFPGSIIHSWVNSYYLVLPKQIFTIHATEMESVVIKDYFLLPATESKCPISSAWQWHNSSCFIMKYYSHILWRFLKWFSLFRRSLLEKEGRDLVFA